MQILMRKGLSMQQTALNVKSAVTFTKSHFFIGVSFGMTIRQGYEFTFCFLLEDAVDDDEKNSTLYEAGCVFPGLDL